MSLRLWNIGILLALGLFWLASGTQREKPVLAGGPSDAVRTLEADLVKSPGDPARIRALAQAYLDARASGMAVATLERAPEAVRAQPETVHMYARALLDQGRASEALTAERKVLAACNAGTDAAAHTCSGWLLASATRRAVILQELVDMGIEDPNAHPEASSLAYQHVTREARLVP